MTTRFKMLIGMCTTKTRAWMKTAASRRAVIKLLMWQITHEADVAKNVVKQVQQADEEGR